MEVVFTLNEDLPPLAWLARFAVGAGSLHVAHGLNVEHGESFLVEGVWDAPFESAGFARADHFFGSGLLVQENGITVVPSRALVDRLLLCQTDDGVHVSNSLPLLLAATGRRLDPTHSYGPESYSSLKGLRGYSSRFQMLDSGGEPVDGEQLYHYPVTIDQNGRRLTGREQTIPRFDTFSDYKVYLKAVLRRIADNAKSPRRRHPMELRTTTSAGYDSTAVTVLLRDEGAGVTYTRSRSNSTIPAWLSRSAAIDDGGPVARTLGYDVNYLQPPEKVSARHELLLLAATTAEPELAFHSLAKDRIQKDAPVALFTGYHGDKAWDRATSGHYMSSDLIRGDTSGLNLGEFRLEAKFINIAVPFIGARSVKDLVHISNSAEMRPWQLDTDYDRPIARRIAEEAGVERDLFGIRKKAVIQSYYYPRNRELRQTFFKWLRQEKGFSSLRVYSSELANQLIFVLRRVVQKTLARIGVSLADPVLRFGVVKDLPQIMHRWAVDSLAEERRKAIG